MAGFGSKPRTSRHQRDGAGEARLSVLARPVRPQPYATFTSLLYDACSAGGMQVDELTAKRVLTGGHEVLHVHWPEEVTQAPGVLSALKGTVKLLGSFAIARLRGLRIVWTVHNRRPHNVHRPWLLQFFRAFAWLAYDGLVFLTHASRSDFLAEHPRLANRTQQVIPHGHYRETARISRRDGPAPERASAGTPEIVFVGRIRTYKNVPALVDAFRQVAPKSARLRVAGLPAGPESEDERKRIEETVGDDARVVLEWRVIPDTEIAAYFDAASVAIMPYTRILNSGSALWALSFDTPIVVPGVGSMPELRDTVGADWVYTYDPPFSADVMNDVLSWLARRNPVDAPPLDDLDWGEIAALYRQFFDRVCGQSRQMCRTN